ncbi:SDR family NAD(P)-dependent oxidoreductase [Oscillatoria sp. HE19RPO]|uniref:SDR family NAD(P)-dependent oxidoreductase n=1 Tax=Oscillatoria sp. HE19RPO TaxID=2954806 RepID=UPI0020C525E9|nr:SDR family NAD(P)-dependent oxidoreductase [Oscillatoria sp. HE19RPO]
MPVTEKQYSMDNVRLFEMAFGEEFMSCGGSAYLAVLFADEELGSSTHILDVCCGLGGSAFYLEKEYGVRVTGIDREAELIDCAKRRAQERSSKCEFILGDVIATHFDDNSFDYIICRDALLHFDNEGKNQLLQKIRSWLKPGGKFLATDYGISDRPLTQDRQEVLDRKGYHLLMQSDYYDLFEHNTFIRIQVSDDTESYTRHTQAELDRLLAQENEITAQYSAAAFANTVESFKKKLQDIEDGIKTYWLIQAEKYSIQSQKLKGRVAICTGASSGIGRSTAIVLAAQGATVVLAARNADKLNTVKALIEEQGGACFVAPTDVSQREQVLDLVGTVMERYGRVDVLINAAGVMFYTFMENGVFEEWARTIDVNITGVVNCIGAVLPEFIRQKSGHIINVSSDAAKTPFSGLSVYCASKAFVTTLSQNLRNELRGKGIKITDVQPGDVRTDLVRTNSDTKALDALGINPQFKVGHGWASNTQLLSPFDVADCIVGAVMAKPHVGINEVLIEPRDQA